MCQYIDYANKLSHYEGISACDLKVISVGGYFLSLFLQLTYYSIEKKSRFLEKTIFLASKKFSVSKHVPRIILSIKLDHRFNCSAEQILLFALRKLFLGFYVT